MGTLRFKRVTRDVENCSFDCGVDSINEYVRNSYYPMLVQHAYAYSIMCGNIVMGYYQVLFREIEIEDFPEEISDYDPGLKENRISALHIRFIAIGTEYQNRRVGTSTLQIIIGAVVELASQWPVRVITIDARLDLVNWYKQMGFTEMEKNTSGQEGTTVAMYFDCMRFSEEFEEYIESVVEE